MIKGFVVKDKKIKEKLDNLLGEARKDKDILAVALFGSFVKGGYYRDIDVCLFLNKKLSDKKRFSKLLKYNKYDLFDVKIFDELPLYIRKRVLEEGNLLLCKNEDRLYEVAFNTIKDFNLFEKYYNDYLSYVKNG